MNNKYDVEDIVYISDCNKVVECKIIEITKTIMSTTYKLKSKDFHTYCRPEHEVFESVEKANEWINKLNLRLQINTLESKVCDYQRWVSDLDFAIQHYEECETNIEIHLPSNQTNKEDEILFAVTSTRSKTLLENIRKYFKEEFDKREKELIKLKEQLNGKK
jgi:hypothetical protein